ncbi:hypothetical protein J3R82DRAFT_3659 [Butyriboletus roseoflavus]|nr:hypothetical protein J3R82DRAFT_3659 [Butyriboletus roseoflavus]
MPARSDKSSSHQPFLADKLWAAVHARCVQPAILMVCITPQCRFHEKPTTSTPQVTVQRKITMVQSQWGQQTAAPFSQHQILANLPKHPPIACITNKDICSTRVDGSSAGISNDSMDAWAKDTTMSAQAVEMPTTEPRSAPSTSTLLACLSNKAIMPYNADS